MIENCRSIGQHILVIDKYMKLYLKTALKPYEINTAEGMVLLVLYGHDGKTETEILEGIHCGTAGLTQEQIIDEIHYDKGVMTRTMQDLECKNYVTRAENDADGRSSLFYLTTKAKEFKPTLIKLLRHWNDTVLQGFDSETIERLDSCLNSMMKSARFLVESNKE